MSEEDDFFNAVKTGDVTVYFNQGAKVGHEDGESRVGQFAIGEDIEASWDALDQLSQDPPLTEVYKMEWLNGYRFGYGLAAEGEELP